MLFGEFWGVVVDVVFLNYYSGILKRKHIYKKPDNNNFHNIVKFFCIIIEAMVIMLYMHKPRYSMIDKLQIQIDRFDQLTLINKIEHNHLEIFIVKYI